MNQPYEIPVGNITPILSPRRAAQAAADAAAMNADPLGYAAPTYAAPEYVEPAGQLPPEEFFTSQPHRHTPDLAPPVAGTSPFGVAPVAGAYSPTVEPDAWDLTIVPPASAAPAYSPPAYAAAPPPTVSHTYEAPTAPPAYDLFEASAPVVAAPTPPPAPSETSTLLEQALADITSGSASTYDLDDEQDADDSPFFEEPTAGEGNSSPRLNVDADLIAALTDVLYSGASDLHVTVNAPPTIRVDGVLRQVGGTSVWNRAKVTSALLSILTPEQRVAFDKELELDLAYTLSANARFRVNIYQQRNSMGAAFRLIPTEIKQLKDLGVPETIGRFAKLPRGLVLVTGPTGSGKSTTLAALIDLVNRTRADHIVTVEDPIEFMHKNHKSLVNQREVGPDTHSFQAALKHVLRQDPDVILIGELRDLETISVALTAAETGHLVFATLHTQDAAQTIDRIIDVFPPHQQGQVRSQLAAVLQGVVCQTLVKKASGSGRVVATEILIATPAINNLIREGKTYQIASAMQAGRDHGMHTMDSHLADLANAGTITVAAAIEKAQDAESLKQLIHRNESATDVAAQAMAATGIDFKDAYSRKIGE
ncbi:type IV pilus twitching motility protein PilT [Glaciihabitans sp. INWT7]|uniref:type IV pilus twitching motility protein PilT n=1 Tax=Glaciihabitans sp. INWT7 TaxID=2596912 RepID=UPI0021052498|nr:type IV pilus twitching motility protein PilT [Glaciihabitans sp. INWT7]